jgi:CheY-like chemotaxis protein
MRIRKDRSRRWWLASNCPQLRVRIACPLRVLVLTTYDLDEYVYDALNAGASGFLLKDAPPEQLAAGIRTIADGESRLAPTVTRRLIETFLRQRPRAAPGTHPTVRTRTRGAAPDRPRTVERRDRGRTRRVWGDSQDPRSSRLSKLGLRDRVQAVVLAYESGMIAPGSAPLHDRQHRGPAVRRDFRYLPAFRKA